MPSRYWITGAQIGVIRVLVDKDPEQVREMLSDIEEHQFIASADLPSECTGCDQLDILRLECSASTNYQCEVANDRKPKRR